MKRQFRICDIVVGDPKRALVIPEIGINHEGSLKVAKEMAENGKIKRLAGANREKRTGLCQRKQTVRGKWIAPARLLRF